jgi:hypothetical protein
MSKLFLAEQSTYTALKQLQTVGEQSIRDNSRLARLLPADKTERSVEAEKVDLESRISGFDIDKEVEKGLTMEKGTVVIAPLSMNFKYELNLRCSQFDQIRHVSAAGFFSYSPISSETSSSETSNIQEKNHVFERVSPK